MARPRTPFVPPAIADPARVRSLPPRLAPGCRVLLLGSMPGLRSLQLGQYYGHPHNRFWPYMQALFGIDRSLPYEERIERLNAIGIGLWDTLASCERPGSLDSAIRPGSEVPNAIPELLAAQPELRTIATNGGKSAQVFRRHALPRIEPALRAQLRVLELPSTSPANMSIAEERKLASWARLQALLDWPQPL